MKNVLFAMALAWTAAAAAGNGAAAPAPERSPRPAATEPQDVPDNIGSATMEKDGTLVLSLIYWFPDGGHTTPARFVYGPRHPEYKKVLRHLGGIKPGQVKGVKPWPTPVDTPVPKFDFRIPPELKDHPLPADQRATK